MKPTSTYPRCRSSSTSVIGNTIFERRVQRCSLVDGGSSPGTMNGPMVPPSNRMVRCGAKLRCARVAASSGMPMPANTICPSFRRREAITASSSEAVKAWEGGLCLVIVDTPAAAARIEYLIHPDLGEVVGPGLGAVVEFLQIVLAALHRILRRALGIGVELGEEGLVDAVAF